MYESTRVKGLAFHNGFLASISSNGDVTIWTVKIDERDITELCSTNIGCRPICLSIIDLSNFAKDYVLKIEGASDEETKEISDSEEKPRKKSRLNAPTGKVIIEVENEENGNGLATELTPSKPAKGKKSANKRKQQNGSNGAHEQTDSLEAKKKAKNNNTSVFVEEDVVESPKAKVAKVNKRKSVANFVEEDISSSKVTTPAKKAGAAVPKSAAKSGKVKGGDRLNQTIADIGEVAEKVSSKKLKKKSRVSLA